MIMVDHDPVRIPRPLYVQTSDTRAELFRIPRRIFRARGGRNTNYAEPESCGEIRRSPITAPLLEAKRVIEPPMVPPLSSAIAIGHGKFVVAAEQFDCTPTRMPTRACLA